MTLKSMIESQPQSLLTNRELAWIDLLRTWRNKQGIRQADLARLAGLSVSAIRAYEHGRRYPSRNALLSLIAALGIPRDEANQLMASAGYAADIDAVLRQSFAPFTLQEMEARGAPLAWPAFATNQTFDVIYGNRAAQHLMQVDVDREYSGFGERNILGGISHERFASRLENWDEVVTFICGLVKGDSEWASADLRHISPWLRRPLDRFREGEPARIKRFAELWQSATPIPNRIHHAYNLRWRYGETQTLAFSCRMTLADIATGVHWNEWLPADAETFGILREIT